jgi:hypothetical protein
MQTSFKEVTQFRVLSKLRRNERVLMKHWVIMYARVLRNVILLRNSVPKEGKEPVKMQKKGKTCQNC